MAMFTLLLARLEMFIIGREESEDTFRVAALKLASKLLLIYLI
jgi:hypothetical protein